MGLFLFTYFFPLKGAEPFLLNEFPYAQECFDEIFAFPLYGKTGDELPALKEKVRVFSPLLPKTDDRKRLLLTGLMNMAPFSFHLREMLSGKIFSSRERMYWFFTSLLLTRTAIASRSFKQLLKEIGKDSSPLLYFYWGDNLTATIPYLRKKLAGKHCRIVIRFHGTDLYEDRKAEYAPIRKDILAAADLLVPISENGKSYLEKKYPSFSHKIFMSRLGAADRGINPYRSASVKTIVTASSLVPLKRVGLIFNALCMSGISIEWHHFGDGPGREELMQLVRSSPASLKFIFHGQVDNSELIRFYRSNSVDLFMNLSTMEGLPVSIMEALSFGIPVIATNVGGVGELVNNSAGKLLEPGVTAEEAGREIALFLSKDDKSIGSARVAARQQFELKVNAGKNYREFYQEIKKLALS